MTDKREILLEKHPFSKHFIKQWMLNERDTIVAKKLISGK